MNTTTNLLFLVPALAVIIASAGSLAAYCRHPTSLSRVAIALCLAPSLVFLGLFYSLALYIHRSLGSWPTSIGERGFPPDLLAHASLATNYFSALLVTTLFAVPLAFLVCLLVRSWRRWTTYLSFHVLSFVSCVGLMLLAPAPFLNWWWD